LSAKVAVLRVVHGNQPIKGGKNVQVEAVHARRPDEKIATTTLGIGGPEL
jgi:hypothetical protein